ncbi:MAG: GTP pyrophosphokinase family protein [Ancrocorticia sp.]|nr:GTP pyrophosphokinase family protein [Ancrocorticia sp.]
MSTHSTGHSQTGHTPAVGPDDAQIKVPSPDQVRQRLKQVQHLMMIYEFAMEEILTKINILRKEFRVAHDYNPIEHVSSRIKSARSLVEKAHRKGISLTYDALRAHMFDIAGVRLTCSFVSDIYRMRELLLAQTDIKLIDERDYITNPKPNGYKSLHLIVEVPVFLAEGVDHVPVEIQLRTSAMDFWASLEHKLYYKYEGDVPRHMTDSLKLAADVASQLDTSMEQIHQELIELNGKNEMCEDEEMRGDGGRGDDADELIVSIMESLASDDDTSE